MSKIIWIRGASSSGKTGSIRKFLENRGVFFPANPLDVSVVLPIQKNGETYVLGIASAGDTAKHVEDNFKFFKPHKCDVIVCASKSKGVSMDKMKKQINRLGANSVEIPTNKLVGAAVTKSAINREINAIAKKIEQSIP